MARWRHKPIRVAQPEPRLCWAAAIKAYTYATPGVRSLSMAEIIGIAKRKKRVEADGTLKNERKTRITLKREFSLTSDNAQRLKEKRANRFDPSLSLDDVPRDAIPTDYFADKLSNSHVVFAYYLGAGPSGSGVWHMVTVFGFDRFSYCYMDPLRDDDPVDGRAKSADQFYRCLRFSDAQDLLIDYMAFWYE